MLLMVQFIANNQESANKMRSKIEANEYKDYILGFIFYKYLSDQEIKFLKKMSLMTMILAILMKVTKRRLTISAKI